MKTIKYIVIAVILIIVFSAGLTSCASAGSIQNNDTEVAGYTLKNKSELMQQEVLKNKIKTVVVLP
jgi:tRNA U34 2-thiouridine synthase MnmA/TrmU